MVNKDGTKIQSVQVGSIGGCRMNGGALPADFHTPRLQGYDGCVEQQCQCLKGCRERTKAKIRSGENERWPMGR